MTLTCKFKSGPTREVLVPFEPPLVKYDELKPRMLKMKAIAEEQFGMVSVLILPIYYSRLTSWMQTKAPQITSFQFPKRALRTIPIVTIITYFALAPVDEMVNPSLLFTPARVVNSLIGPKPFLYAFYVQIVAHVLEAAYTFILCRRHRTGFFVGVCNITMRFRKLEH